ncbi:hypothetical protein PHYBLDRAFT_152373 [Phycomyces blakesleeanus NRRL 1555(-)]|uniref:Uncharacterized protein n=1 Tax=Phycomyces blakesleeanus (strain ATCC 8743b / DSM 1359 / FGSC 10004 / NBRC 33097 / NRRL 1555) TaxID=763407 RepID=A0A162N7P9_PHYB8|nr:hypothetical protein PHYBLDRAFT_152373 [Phycomyces blakesleeanus NRRL 1555(-)]OAD66574.1 hypothetical protein PHYBLDRAFT_152373 [Phycomyces blakesleeanus NRRL 1555(-)]|eukprot:XP_018284614.1 hypothetical protein PHYBLDRAFT_152373 [Phycomyces blakesleeanus NRRL 1555(-)]
MIFGKCKVTISIIFNDMIRKLARKFGHALVFDKNQFWEKNLVCFIQAILRADGTFIRTARPLQFQKRAYSEHYVKLETGRRHDAYIDKAYANSLYMMCLFRQYSPDLRHKDVNTAMSSVRIVMKNEFAHIGNLFAYIEYPQSQCILLCPVGSYYLVATFLKNLHICFNRGNRTSKRFGVVSPTSAEYISGLLENI